MKRDFRNHFTAERKTILFSILAEAITAIISLVIIWQFNQVQLVWIVLVGLLGILAGLIIVGSYLWLQYSSQPEVEEKESVKQEQLEVAEKVVHTKEQIGRLEEERVMIDRDEQNAISHRNREFQEQLATITDQKTQLEITYQQTLQNALKQFQTSHIRNGLSKENLANIHFEAEHPERFPEDWHQKLIAHQIISVNDLIPECLAQTGLEQEQIQALLKWRTELEAEYRATQPTELPASEIAALSEEFREQTAHLEKEEIIAKAGVEKDFFEIRGLATKRRERNKSGLSVAHSALRGLDEKQQVLKKEEQSYTNIHFRRYFTLALGSVFGADRTRSAMKAGLVNLLVLGVLIFQGTLGLRAMRVMLNDTPAIPPLQSDVSTSFSNSEQACIPSNTPRQSGIVSRVVDGDTIDVQIDGQDVRVRYIGVDAPEPNQFYGGLSMNRNIQLVVGQEVVLVQDVSETDAFGRWLRYVLVGEVFVNYQLVLKGDARATSYPPDTACQSTFEAAQEIARTNQTGLWRLAATPQPTTTLSPFSTDTFTDLPAPCSCVSNTLNCSDFNTQVKAQACYQHCLNQGAGDIHRLDGNGDGKACEALP